MKTANDDFHYSEYLPAAESFIKKRFGWYDKDKMFGVETTLHVVAAALWDVENTPYATMENTEPYIEKFLNILERKMQKAAKLGWQPDKVQN